MPSLRVVLLYKPNEDSLETRVRTALVPFAPKETLNFQNRKATDTLVINCLSDLELGPGLPITPPEFGYHLAVFTVHHPYLRDDECVLLLEPSLVPDVNELLLKRYAFRWLERQHHETTALDFILGGVVVSGYTPVEDDPRAKLSKNLSLELNNNQPIGWLFRRKEPKVSEGVIYVFEAYEESQRKETQQKLKGI